MSSLQVGPYTLMSPYKDPKHRPRVDVTPYVMVSHHIKNKMLRLAQGISLQLHQHDGTTEWYLIRSAVRVCVHNGFFLSTRWKLLVN